jgi:hypothetical protein
VGDYGHHQHLEMYMYIIIKSVGKCLIGRCAFFFVGQDIKSLKKQQKFKIKIKEKGEKLQPM